ncbi:MAG: AraC family transcriptional regulator, partial [Bacteroidales bacterium]|nr:AraC family transcriptional regulator [Bacteroidales bacterium]
MTNSTVLKEITPITDKDCLYIVERHKSEFLFPLHSHRDYELNFIENGQGVRRVVGDSVEEIGPFELTLVAGNELEHAWEQGSCVEADVREITIQFSPDLFPENLLNKGQFLSINRMLSKASHGLTFSVKTIMKVYSLLDSLSSDTEPFDQYLHFLKIMYELSRAEDSRILASSSFARASRDKESRRVMKVKQYINDHYAEDLRLESLASLAGMTP